MLPTTFSGDPEFMLEAKEGLVQKPLPVVSHENNLPITDAIGHYGAFAEQLRSIYEKGGQWADFAKTAIHTLERKIIDAAVLALAASEMPNAKSRPVEIYRRFNKRLREISIKSKVYGRDAGQVLRDLYLSQTQPDGELNTPFWTDGMTGETDPEYAITKNDIPNVHTLVPGMGGVDAAVTAMMATVENSARYKRTAQLLDERGEWQSFIIKKSAEVQKDLGWTDTVRWQWVDAQTQSAGSGEIEEIDEPDDDRGYVPTTLQKDLTDGGELETPVDKGCFMPIADDMRKFNSARRDIFAQMAKEHVQGTEWKTNFQQRIRKTDEFSLMYKAIQSTADNYGAREAVAVYLRVAGDYGFLAGEDGSPNDVRNIKLDPRKSIANITSFMEFLEEYEDAISEMMADGSIGVFPTSESVVDDFIKQSKDLLTKSLPSHSHNAMQTSSWNIAYQIAIASGASFADAEAKAWSAWRYAMSFYAAKEYDRVMKVERNRTKAMAAFWRFAPPSVPRPQDIITGVTQSGLRTKKFESSKNERLVTWNIARLKVDKDELALDVPHASRLVDVLKSKGWGSGFDKVVSARYLTAETKK